MKAEAERRAAAAASLETSEALKAKEAARVKKEIADRHAKAKRKYPELPPVQTRQVQVGPRKDEKFKELPVPGQTFVELPQGFDKSNLPPGVSYARDPKTGRIKVHREQYEKAARANRAAVRAGDPEPDKTRAQVKGDRQEVLARRREIISRIRNNPDTDNGTHLRDSDNPSLQDFPALHLNAAAINRIRKLGSKQSKPRRVIEPGSRPIGRAC